MAVLPLGKSVYLRRQVKMAPAPLVNRFFEQDPTNLEEAFSLLTRPGTSFWSQVGTGPLRRGVTQEGVFNSDLFVISGTQLWRTADGETWTPITGAVGEGGSPEMEIISGPGFEHLFIADGQALLYYAGPSFATGTLTLTPSSPPDIATQEVEIAGAYYQWAAALVGTPSGTMGDPFQVLVGANDEESLANLLAAINASGTPGVEYSSTIMVGNTQVTATASDATTVSVQARERGAAGNLISTTVVSGAGLSWGALTLENGGTESLFQIAVPEGRGAVSLAQIGKYLLVVTANDDRWYYIEPGELIIRDNNFYTAEKKGDQLDVVRVIGDEIVLMGTRTIEFWYATGELRIDGSGDPFRPYEGRTINMGVRSGTALQVRDNLLLVGEDNRVYDATGRLSPLSSHGIEELIRKVRDQELGI